MEKVSGSHWTLCPVGGDTRDRRCLLLSIRFPEDKFPGVWVLTKGCGMSIIVGKRRLTAFSLNSDQRPYLSFWVTEGQPYNSKCIRDVCREPSASPEQQWRDSYPSGTAHVFFKLEGSSADPGDLDAPWDRFLWSNSFTLLGPFPSARWELLVHTWGTFLFHPQLDTGGFLSFFGTRRWVSTAPWPGWGQGIVSLESHCCGVALRQTDVVLEGPWARLGSCSLAGWFCHLRWWGLQPSRRPSFTPRGSGLSIVRQTGLVHRPDQQHREGTPLAYRWRGLYCTNHQRLVLPLLIIS